LKTDPNRRFYTEKVLDLYRATPGTRGLARPADRRLAENLFDRGIPIHTVYAAFVLAWTRRSRPPTEPQLRPIATLHYFLPVIDELVAQPLDSDYLDYLRYAHAASAPRLLGANLDLAHQIP
jgi:hypothetical protein